MIHKFYLPFFVLNWFGILFNSTASPDHTGVAVFSTPSSNQELPKLTLANNSTSITHNDTLTLEGLKNISVSFKSLKKIDLGLYGRIKLMADFKDATGSFRYEMLDYSLEGRAACTDFSSSVDKPYYLSHENKENIPFNYNLVSVLHGYKYDRYCRITQVRIRIIYQDKIGYEKYGNEIELASPFVFYVNLLNKSNHMPIYAINATVAFDKATKSEFSRSSTQPFEFTFPQELGIVSKSGSSLHFELKGESNKQVLSTAYEVTFENREAGVVKLQEHITEYALLCSNYKPGGGTGIYIVDKFAQKKTPKNPYDDFLYSLLTGFNIEALKKKKSKDIESIKLFENITLGKNNASRYCTPVVNNDYLRTNFCYVDITIVNNTKDEKKALVVFTRIMTERANDVAFIKNNLDSLLSAIEF